MSRKGTKIKRYGSIYGRSNSSFTMLLIMAAGVAVFGIAGWLLYTPVYNFIMGLGSDSPIEVEMSESVSQPSDQNQADKQQMGTAVAKFNDMAAVYIPTDVMLDDEFLNTTLDNAATAGFNTVIIDAKDTSGKVYYKSLNNIAASANVVADDVFDAAETAGKIKSKGLSPAVRLHTFKDSLAPTVQRDMAVHYYDTEIYWFDNSPELGGKPWLDPYSESARKYLLDMIEELAESGFDTILLDSVHFPQGVGLDKAGFANESGISKADVLSMFIKEAEEVAKQSGSSIVLCTDVDVMAPGAEEQNKWLYGGDAAALFTEKVIIKLDEDSSVWNNRLEMIDEVTDSKLLAMIPAYAADGLLVSTDEVVSKITQTSAVGYALYSPNGNYKFS